MDAFFELIAERWPGVLFRQRADLTLEFASPPFADWTGIALDRWSAEAGLFLDVVHEQDAELMRRQMLEAARQPGGASCAFRLRHRDTGRVTYVSEFRRALKDAGGNATGYVGFWTDATRQVLAERRLAAAAWKETVGLVTQGLAHDFNNVLAGIQGLGDTCLMQIDEAHPFHRPLQLIQQNTRKAAQLVGRIAQLHRGKTGARSYQDLNALLRDNTELLARVLPKRIEFEAVPDAGQLPVYADPVEFQQVLIQLALNAADAMPERGRLVVRTLSAPEIPDASAGQRIGNAPRLPAACLELTDSGQGIKPSLLPFIFDPFFTTKPLNQGSGLGLYNVRLFAEKHDAFIAVDSKEGQGTTFRIWFPISDFTEAEAAQALSQQRRKCLLLVASPGRLRDVTTERLRSAGYFVASADADAEGLLRSAEHSFDAVLLLAEPRDDTPLRLARWIRAQQLPVRILLKPVGVNPDEVDPQLSGKCDLVIAPDSSEETVLREIAEALEG